MTQAVDQLCVRTIAPHELHTFTLVPRVRDDPKRHAELSEHLAERWTAGLSRPSAAFGRCGWREFATSATYQIRLV